MVDQWLELCIVNAEGSGLSPGWGTKIPQVTWCGQKHKNKNSIKNKTKQTFS